MCIVSVKCSSAPKRNSSGTSAPGHFHIAGALAFCSYFNVALTGSLDATPKLEVTGLVQGSL